MSLISIPTAFTGTYSGPKLMKNVLTIDQGVWDSANSILTYSRVVSEDCNAGVLQLSNSTINPVGVVLNTSAATPQSTVLWSIKDQAAALASQLQLETAQGSINISSPSAPISTDTVNVYFSIF